MRYVQNAYRYLYTRSVLSFQVTALDASHGWCNSPVTLTLTRIGRHAGSIARCIDLHHGVRPVCVFLSGPAVPSQSQGGEGLLPAEEWAPRCGELRSRVLRRPPVRPVLRSSRPLPPRPRCPRSANTADTAQIGRVMRHGLVIAQLRSCGKLLLLSGYHALQFGTVIAKRCL